VKRHQSPVGLPSPHFCASQHAWRVI